MLKVKLLDLIIRCICGKYDTGVMVKKITIFECSNYVSLHHGHDSLQVLLFIELKLENIPNNIHGK